MSRSAPAGYVPPVFLYQHPTRLTAGHEQRVWMRVADFTFLFVTQLVEVAATLSDWFREYLSPPVDAPTLTTFVTRGEGSFPPLQPVASMDVSAEAMRMRCASGFEADVARAQASAELRLWPQPIPPNLDNYLRMVISVLALDRGGLLLHSASAVRDDAGYLFTGPSGAGKSTTAGFSYDRGYSILSDDQNLLLPVENAVVLHSVPCKGGLCPVPTSFGSAPVKRVLWLCKDTETRVESLPVAVGGALLASQAAFANVQPELMDRVLQNALDIAGRVRVDRLHFTKSADFWAVL